MSVNDLEEIEIGQLINKINGFYEHQKSREEAAWMRTNYQIYAALLLSPDIKPVNKPKTFDDYLKQRDSKPMEIKNKDQLFKALGIKDEPDAIASPTVEGAKGGKGSKPQQK